MNGATAGSVLGPPITRTTREGAIGQASCVSRYAVALATLPVLLGPDKKPPALRAGGTCTDR